MKRKRSKAIRSYIPQIAMLCSICIFLGNFAPSFFSISNFANVLTQQVPFLLMLSMGMTISIVVKGLDLSIGANMALSSCIAGIVMKDMGVIPGILAGIFTGCITGIINGILIAKVRLPAFIATYGMDWVCKGISYVIMMGMTVYGFPNVFRQFSIGKSLGMSNLILLAAVVYVLMSFVLYKTVFGRNVYAVGLNAEGARYSGVANDWIIIGAYTLNGLLAALTGLLYIGQLDAVDPTIAEGWNIKLIAAVLIGGASMKGGKADLRHTLLGVLILSFLTNGINILGISSLWQQLVIGFVIVASIIIDKVSNTLIDYGEVRREARG